MVLTSSFGASSGATVRDATLECSASKDFCKDSLTLMTKLTKTVPALLLCTFFPTAYNRNYPTP